MSELGDLGHWDLPYTDVPDGTMETPAPIADLFDSCTVRVLGADTPLGPFAVLELTFGNSHLQRSVRVNFVADAHGMRSVGRLLRDSANAAANRLERR